MRRRSHQIPYSDAMDFHRRWSDRISECAGARRLMREKDHPTFPYARASPAPMGARGDLEFVQMEDVWVSWLIVYREYVITRERIKLIWPAGRLTIDRNIHGNYTTVATDNAMVEARLREWL